MAVRSAGTRSAAARGRRLAPPALHQSGDRRRGDVDARLLPPRPRERPADAPRAQQCQRRLRRRARRRHVHGWRAAPPLGEERHLHAAARAMGEPPGRKRGREALPDHRPRDPAPAGSPARGGRRLIDTAVLIVGAGPVGLGLAAELGWLGVPCVLVEQTDGALMHPRANTVNSRTMEFCRRWGIAERVKNSGTPPGFPADIVYLTSFPGHAIARINRPTYGGTQPLDTTPEQSQRCNQLWFDPILRELAAGFSSVQLRYRCRFESVSQSENGVMAFVRDLNTRKRESIFAQYVVACCGGESGVARGLGIRMEGSEVVSCNLNVFLRVPELWSHHDKGK